MCVFHHIRVAFYWNFKFIIYKDIVQETCQNYKIPWKIYAQKLICLNNFFRIRKSLSINFLSVWHPKRSNLNIQILGISNMQSTPLSISEYLLMNSLIYHECVSCHHHNTVLLNTIRIISRCNIIITTYIYIAFSILVMS